MDHDYAGAELARASEAAKSAADVMAELAFNASIARGESEARAIRAADVAYYAALAAC